MIKILKIGYQFVNMGGIDVNRPEGSGDYLFLLFRCPAEVMLDGEYRSVPENTFLLYEKGAPQAYRKLNGHYINDWIHFDIEPYDNYFEQLGIPFGTPIRLPDIQGISEMIFDLLVEYVNVGENHDLIMHQKASALFQKFSDIYHLSDKSGRKMTKYLTVLMDIRKKIQNYEYCPKGVDELSQILNISPSYLQHLYKEFFGISVKKDIIRARVEYASHLLRETEDSITEIARACGYDNLEHFSRQFKKIKGCSPSNFRK